MKKTARSTKILKRSPQNLRAEARVKQAEAKVEQVKAREEQAKAREEQAKAREEQAKAQTEQAKAQAEQAKARAEQVESTLQKVMRKDVILNPDPTPRLLKQHSPDDVEKKNHLEQLTERQREILRLIAEGQNTKQIAELLGVSPKTVEYHRMKLMAGLNLHDIAGLVRFAVKAGLITPED